MRYSFVMRKNSLAFILPAESVPGSIAMVGVIVWRPVLITFLYILWFAQFIIGDFVCL